MAYLLLGRCRTFTRASRQPHRFHPPSGGAGGEKPRTVTGGADAGRKFPARPVRTPGRAHGLSDAHSGRTPWRWPQCCRFSLVPPLAIDNGEQAATPPPLNSVAAVRAAAIPGRRTLNAAGAGQGLGSPASADARPAGGARSRGPLCSPAANTGREGGDPLAAPLLCPRTRSAVTYGDKKGPNGP